MEENIDILAFLEQVMLENTHSYRDDFQLDIRKLTAAAQAPEAGNRAFYWMSRPCGTWCLSERSVFIQDSFEHCAWTAYENEAATIRAFLVIVSGQEQGRPMGKVSPIDYKSNVLNVEKNALHAETVVLNFADGETVTLPYEQVKGRFSCFIVCNHSTSRTFYVPIFLSVHDALRLSFRPVCLVAPVTLQGIS